MEGVRIFEPSELSPNNSNNNNDIIERDLKQLLTGLAFHLFGKDSEIKWKNDFFPFTEPSFELEVCCCYYYCC